MATTVKITTIGNSVGIVLPKEVLNRLHVEEGLAGWFRKHAISL